MQKFATEHDNLCPAERISGQQPYPWFAIRVKANRELVTAVALRSRGYEEFVPMYRCRRRWSDRVKDVHLPLFPGYVFGRFDSSDRLPVLTIPGVVHLVGIGRTPVPVENAEIEALQAVARSGIPTKPWPFLRVGDRIVLGTGPLRGTAGILLSEKDDDRLIISVTLLQRSVSVEIDRGWVVGVESHFAGRKLQLLA